MPDETVRGILGVEPHAGHLPVAFTKIPAQKGAMNSSEKKLRTFFDNIQKKLGAEGYRTFK